VFEPYFSVGREGEARRGLGLTTVQAVVEGHGGWVDLHSQPGDGTVVTLHLPLAGPEPEGEAARGGIPEKEAASSPPLILLLEDEPLLLRLLERTLIRRGFRVESAANLAEAQDLWTRHGSHADLVVVERHLPGGDGALAMVLEWVGEREDLLLILLDRRASPGDPPPEGVGESAFFSRPFDPSDVASRIARQLEARRSAGSSRGPGSGPGLH